MSLTSNVNDISYYSGYDIDKIARIFTGSYNDATNVITRNYTYAGMPLAVKFYRIPHGMSRPLACELQWSVDGGLTYLDGGMSTSSFLSNIAFSDDTYVYIFDLLGVMGVTEVHYRIYCSWIDDFDTTNPLETVVTYNDVPQQFDSRENYQKIYKKDELTFTPGVFGANETQVIVHPLGYAPNVKVYFEAFAGEVWPLNAGGLSNPFLIDDLQNECLIAVDVDSLNITVKKFSNTPVRSWYKIFYDAT